MRLWRVGFMVAMACALAACPRPPEGLPTAEFTLTPDHGPKDLNVTFTDTSTPGDAPITAWAWDFGDGDTSTVQNPVHAYTKNGVYDVELKVTNSIGSNTILKSEAVIVGNTWAAMDGYDGDDKAVAVSATGNSDVLILSTVVQAGQTDTDLQLQRRSVNGNVIWTQFYGGTEDDTAASLVFNDGEITVCGSTRSYGLGGTDVYVIHTDAQGDVLWTDTFGTTLNDSAEKIILVDDGYVMVGATTPVGKSVSDVYLLKIDLEGEFKWSKSYGTNLKETGHGVRQTSDKGFIIAGEQGNATYFAVRTDSAGVEKWSKAYTWSGTNRAYEPFQQGENFILIGSGYSEGVTGYDVVVLKADKDGKELSRSLVGGLGREEVFGAVGSGGTFTVVGSTTSNSAGGKDVYLVNIKADGTKAWSSILGGTGDDVGYGIGFVSGELLIAGSTTSFGAVGTDNYILRTTAGGFGVAEPDPAL